MKRVLFLVGVCFAIVAPANAQSTYFDKFTAYVGAGFSNPIGRTNDHVGIGFNFSAGAGPRFRHFTLPVDFSYNTMDADTLNDGGDDTLIDGNLQMWSITLNPTVDYIRKEKVSAYVSGGYGVYNRRVELTRADLTAGVVCDEWWGYCFVGAVPAETILGSASTYKGGFNVGTGATFGERTKFYVEVRYQHMFTTNHATKMIPVTFGVRW